MNSTKITSCFVGSPLWPIMNLMNIKRGDGREGGKGMKANTFQPRCVAFTWRFVTLNNGTIASVFVPLICLCVSASSLSPPSTESRQLKNNCWLHGLSDKGEVLRWIPNSQPARGAESERGSKTTTGKSKVELARVPKQARDTSSLVKHSHKQHFCLLKAAEHLYLHSKRCLTHELKWLIW